MNTKEPAAKRTVMKKTTHKRVQKSPAPMTPLEAPLQKTFRSSDGWVFWLSCASIVVPGIFISVFAADVLSTVIGIAVLVLLVMIVIRFMHVQMMANAMRVQNSSYAHLKKDIDEICKNLNVPVVDVYVTQNPFLNAFAFGFVQPYAITLHSATVEQLEYEEMRAIFIHEIGHIKLGHTRKIVFVSALSALPVVGVFATWVFGFWSRRAEYAADRLALAYTGDPDLVIKALMKVYIGPESAKMSSKEYILYQDQISKGFFRSFVQTFSSHPFLVNRVKAALRFADINGFSMADDLRYYLRNSSKS